MTKKILSQVDLYDKGRRTPQEVVRYYQDGKGNGARGNRAFVEEFERKEPLLAATLEEVRLLKESVALINWQMKRRTGLIDIMEPVVVITWIFAGFAIVVTGCVQVVKYVTELL